MKQTNDSAPRSHNLIYLSEKANLLFEEDDEILLGILMKYQLQGRYPDYNPFVPDKAKINRAFLFGSYSTDTATESSDIDVMIVSDKYDENDDVIIGIIWKLTRKIKTKIEPFFIGDRKFREDDSSPLINMIKDKGIEIV